MERADRHGIVTRRTFLARSARLGIAAALLPSGLRELIGRAAAAAPAGASTVRVVSHGDRSLRQIALTVVDGWSPERVGQIFDILQRSEVDATFMPYARTMRGASSLWRGIAAAGYPIGNHTVSHPDLTRLSSTRQRAEIADARGIAEDITGEPTVPFFRPPYGAYNQSVVNAAVAAGYPTIVLWDTSDRDTSPSGTAQHMIDAAERGTNGSILLTHGGPALTPTILPTIVAHYRQRGFQFVTLSKLLGEEPERPARFVTP